METRRYTITGDELRSHREAANLTQAELARRAGFARDAVWYWEGKDQAPLRSGAPAAFAKVLGVSENAGFPDLCARADIGFPICWEGSNPTRRAIRTRGGTGS